MTRKARSGPKSTPNDSTKIAGQLVSTTTKSSLLKPDLMYPEKVVAWMRTSASIVKMVVATMSRTKANTSKSVFSRSGGGLGSKLIDTEISAMITVDTKTIVNVLCAS